jgi:ABC-type Fe3+ transport system permease subunit/DNA-binding beta-propeller fold protein YncE
VNWLLLQNSLLVGGMATLLAVACGWMMALRMTSAAPRWRGGWLLLSVAALALPPFLVGNCWLDLLGNTGVWRRWVPLNINSPGGAIWILGLLLWPITALWVTSAWQRLEAPQLESDPALTGWPLIRYLLIPAARGALVQAAIVTFALALGNFAVPAMLQIKVLPAEMWIRFSTTFDTRGALQLSWPLVVLPLVLLLWWSRQDFPWPRVTGAFPAALFREQLGPVWYWLGAGFGLLLAGLSVALPLGRLIWTPRTWVELPGALAAGQAALWHSLATSVAAATLCLPLGLLAARWKAGAILWLPFLVPGIFVGMTLIPIFNRPGLAGFHQSLGIVVVAFLIRYLAVGRHALARALESIDRDLFDAAKLEGASGWRMFLLVYRPQTAARCAAAWYVIYLLCLWDVESMLLVVPPGGETLALRIFNLLHYGHNAQVNALCLVLLGAAVFPLVLWKVAGLLRPARAPHSVSSDAAGDRNGGSGSAAPRQAWWSARVALSLAGFLLFLPGCSPSQPDHSVALESRIFERATVIGARGTGLGQLNKPRSVAVDFADALYVVDMTGRVQKFSPAGRFLLSWQMPQTDLGKPKGMCRDNRGNIIVIEPHYQRLNYFTPEGKLVAQWGQRGTNAGQFTLPRAVAVNSFGEAFVSEYSAGERVQKFASESGQFLNSFGVIGTEPGEFNRPEGLCVDSQDRLYVADSCNHRIQVFSREGRFLRAYGKAGGGKGELSYPYDIQVDSLGRQYVCEFGNSRIQVFDSNDRPLEIIGGPGAAPGQFSNPWGIALDSAGNLYVADSMNHRVQKFEVRRPNAS